MCICQIWPRRRTSLTHTRSSRATGTFTSANSWISWRVAKSRRRSGRSCFNRGAFFAASTCHITGIVDLWPNTSTPSGAESRRSICSDGRGPNTPPFVTIEPRFSRPLRPLAPTFHPIMQSPFHPISPEISRRSFLKASAVLAGRAPLLAGADKAQLAGGKAPLMAYVGTFSSPLRDVLPTQVDLPPGNGRGIHLYQVDRTTGAMTPSGVYALGTSPNCLALNVAGTRLYSTNETDRVGEGNEGTVSAFAIDRADGQLTLLNTVRSGGAGPTYVSIHPSGKFVLVANYFGGSVAVLPILPDGRLGSATDIKKDAGKLGPTKATDAPPGSFAFSGHDRTHAHMIQADA